MLTELVYKIKNKFSVFSVAIVKRMLYNKIYWQLKSESVPNRVKRIRKGRIKYRLSDGAMLP